MATTLTTFDDVLKYDYLGPIQEQFANSNILMKRLERNSEDVGGKKAVVPLHKSRNTGVGSRADGGALPTAGNQGYDTADYNCAYTYGRIQISGPTIKASRSNKYAFVKAVDSEIQGTLKDLKDDVNRQLHGDGTGQLCLLNGDPGTGTTLTADNPGTMYLSAGMKLHIVAPNSTTAGDFRSNVGEKTVASKTSATAVEVSTAFHADAADNDIVVRSNNYRLEMMGLKGIVKSSDPGTSFYCGGISRATAGNEFWKAEELENSGTARKLTQVA